MSVCSDFEVCGTECTQKVPCVERVASGASFKNIRITGARRCRETVMVSASGSERTFSSPNGFGNFQLRPGGGSARSSMLFEK